MEFFEVVARRRSIRQFIKGNEGRVPDEAVQKGLEAALLAPNSSNTQTWNFYWLKSTESKGKVVQYCLNQAAARTASQLVVVTADPALWRRSHGPLLQMVNELNPHPSIKLYYQKLIPFLYRWGFMNTLVPLKWVLTTVMGITKPFQRGPHSKRDLQEVAIKSAALACENFALAMTAQGFATCMMEGFDEWRLRWFLKLGSSERVVMVIGIGKESDRGTWGPQFRLPFSSVVKEV